MSGEPRPSAARNWLRGLTGAALAITILVKAVSAVAADPASTRSTR